MSAFARFRHSEEGLTVIELMVAGLVSALIVGAILAMLTSVQTVLNRETEKSINNDEVRLAVEQIDREIRSGSIIYSPDSPQTLRVLTRSNGIERCVQWSIVDRELLRREWPRTTDGSPPDPDDVSGSRIVATGIVNEDLGLAAFTISPMNDGRTVDVTVVANNHYEKRPGQTVRVEQSLTARNTAFGLYGPSECIPPA